METNEPILRDQQKIDTEYLRIINIFYYVTSGLSVLSIGFVYLHYLIFTTAFADPNFTKSMPGFPTQMHTFMKWGYLAFGCFAGIAAILNLITALNIRKRKNYTAILVVAGLNCIQFPFGTLLGAATIIILLRETVKIQFNKSQHPASEIQN